MCGIFGVYGSASADALDPDVLDRMARALVHRGPDGGGVHVDGQVGIGMRRLSIIDLATGHQPLANEDGSVWVVFNGEIYNYRELTRELIAKGHRFATASDTEVLVHLYEEAGAQGIERLRGMFAFAIWDLRRRRMLLARDRLGIKPLYWAQTPRGVVFGSELKAVIQSPWVARSIDEAAVASYLELGYVPDPQSILKHTQKLAPGHTLVVEDGRASEPQRYWNAVDCFRRPVRVASEEEAGRILWEHLRDAVRSHLVSDVPLGAFLSGGVDSSTIVALMAMEGGSPIRTFSIGFREHEFNELQHARRVAHHFGTEHHEVLVDPRDIGLLEHILRSFDEPAADASAIPTYLVSRLAREHVKVVLSGDGGDELFAGYDRYEIDHSRRRFDALGSAGFGGGLRRLSGALPEGTPGKNYLYNVSLPRPQRYLDSVSLFPRRTWAEIFERDVPAAAGATFDRVLAAGRELDPLSQLQQTDLQTYLPGDILTKVDRMSMAHSLEARVPLLDHPLVEYACGLPARLRMRGSERKYLLRRVLRDKLPAGILERPKQGFGVPLESWFASQLPGFFRDLLGDGRRLQRAGLRPAAVRAQLDVYERKRRDDHSRRLWALAVLDRSLDGLLGGATA